MNETTFCAYPFNTLFLGADGDIKPCCSSGARLGNINEFSVEEIVHGKMLTEIRQSIVEGKWHPSCGQCEKLEQYGARTERTGVLHKFEEFKDATKDTFKLQKLDLRWSNTCNLSCNYCYEYFSSKWATLKGIKVNANKASAEDSMFTLIERSTGTIEELYLLGGEPLLQKQNNHLLDLLHDKKYYILTNLSVDVPNNPIAKKLLANKNVSWGVSFENIGDKFEYVRHGADWKTLTANLQYVKDTNPKEINAHPLYCAYSAFDLCEYYDFLTSNDIFTQSYWCVIQNIPGLNVFTLPDGLKIKALDELDRCISKFKNTRFDMSALEEIRKNLYNSLITSRPDEAPEGIIDANYRDRTAFLMWIDTVEMQYLTDKKHSFEDLWPSLYAELINEKPRRLPA
jgi:radical SAM protein with 4Fe4S-binding SPASM domain